MLLELLLVLIAVGVSFLLHALWQAEQKRKSAPDTGSNVQAVYDGQLQQQQQQSQVYASSNSRQSRRFTESSIFQLLFFKSHSLTSGDGEGWANGSGESVQGKAVFQQDLKKRKFKVYNSLPFVSQYS
jgi:hypothetical protein